jgi:amidase
MQTLSRDTYITSFNAANPFHYTVADGETFSVETHDAYKGQIRSEKTLRPHIDRSCINCSTGPIEVRGAETGDTLCVEVLDIRLGTCGIMVANPGMGFCGDNITEADTKIVPVENGGALFAPGIRLPLTPMVGVLGVAPAEGDVHCTIPGDHGANLDAKVISAGAKVYLPVFIKGAGLAVGDVHACMGDGELSGTAVEIEGTVQLKTTVLKKGTGQYQGTSKNPGWVCQLCSRHPVVETADSVYTLASAKEFRDAARTAVDEAIRFLMEKWRLSFPDAYRLASAACDIQICQVVNPLLTVRVRIPKYLLEN